MILSLVIGVRFVYIFSLSLLAAAMLPRVIGAGDIKLLCLLIGTYGVTRTCKIFLSGLLMCLILNLRKDLKTRIALAPYFLGGYLCVELLRL